jgi:DNA-binding transcriptional ArsR family regulator
MQMDTTTLVFRALADPTRRGILEVIAIKPTHVAQLAERFPMSRPAISKHLGVLKSAGLVRFTEQGKKRLYTMEPAPLKSADLWLEHYRHFWTESLHHLKLHSEGKHASRKKKKKN